MSTTFTPKPKLSLDNPELRQWKAAVSDRSVTSTPGLFSSAFFQETGAMTRRLFIQLQRRPSTLIAGVIQPVMWLILFGALFQNVPAGLFGESRNYGQFLGAGIIVFTAFGGALNAGLPVMFDREFGFLNRFLVAPPRLALLHRGGVGYFHCRHEHGANCCHHRPERPARSRIARPRWLRASGADCAHPGAGGDGAELGVIVLRCPATSNSLRSSL